MLVSGCAHGGSGAQSIDKGPLPRAKRVDVENRRKTYKKPMLERLGTLEDLERTGDRPERAKTARELARDGRQERKLGLG